MPTNDSGAMPQDFQFRCDMLIRCYADQSNGVMPFVSIEICPNEFTWCYAMRISQKWCYATWMSFGFSQDMVLCHFLLLVLKPTQI